MRFVAIAGFVLRCSFFVVRGLTYVPAAVRGYSDFRGSWFVSRDSGVDVRACRDLWL